MGAIAAGSVVSTAVLLLEGETLRPEILLGACESATGPVNPGDPPTNVVVAWQDGTRQTYAVAEGILVQLVPPSAPSLLGSIMSIAAGVIPNAGGRSVGPVILHVSVGDASGGSFAELLVARTKLGILILPPAAVQILPNA